MVAVFFHSSRTCPTVSISSKMPNKQLLTLFFTTVFVILFSWTPVHAGPAPYTLCTETEKPIMSRGLEVDVSECESVDRCPLYIGKTHNFTVKFVPTVNLNGEKGIERYILAKFPGTETDKPLEIPYGAAEVANNNTFKASDGRTITESGNKVQSDQQYIHNSLFPVLSSAPKTNLTVRYVIREKVAGLGRRRVTWKTHPGTLLACIEIPVELTSPPDS